MQNLHEIILQNVASNTLLQSLLNGAKIKKQYGRFLSVYNNLLYLQARPKVRIIGISIYSAITFSLD